MATYADYETFEEHQRGAFATVWKARGRSARANEVFAVKVWRPADWQEEGADPASWLATVMDVVADLRTLGEKRAEHWAPVLASGSDGTEAFWVTRFYARSLQTVQERRAQLPLEDIHWIATSVVRALAELEKHLNRPHGNLKPTNVFIDGEGRLKGLPVVLSDLKPRDQLASLEDQVADFRELGRMIVSLVRRRQLDSRKAIGWPLETGVEWRRFGRQGENWRELCNQLLNPHPAPADLDWAKLGEDLRRLTPRNRTPLIVAAAVALPLVALTGFGAYLRLKPYDDLPRSLQGWAVRVGNVPKDVIEVPPEWAQLCQAYNEWLGAFMEVAADPARTAAWSRQPYLKERVLGVLLAMKQNYDSLDPRKLAGVTGALETLQIQPPEAVKKGLVAHNVVEVARAVQQAVQAVTDWPERRRLDEVRKRFETLGWTNGAAEIQRAVERSGTGALSYNAINDLLELSPPTARTESLWRTLEQNGQTLAGVGDPVMRGIVPHLRTRVAGADSLTTLNRELADAVQDVTRWLDLIQAAGGQPRMDRERFTRESPVRDFTGNVTAEAIAQWEREVQDFQYVVESEDPRLKTDWTSLIRKVDESMVALREEEGSSPADTAAGGVASARFQQGLDETRRTVEALRAGRLVRKDLPGSGQKIQATAELLRALDDNIRTALAELRPDPADWLSRARQGAIGAAGSALRREWERRRDLLLADANPAALARNMNDFRALRDRQRVLERFFTVFSGQVGVGSLPKLEIQNVADELVPPLQDWARTRTGQAVEEWLGAVTWAGLVPAASAEAFLGNDAARGIAERLGADLREAAELGTDFTAVTERLIQADGLDSAGATVAKWSQRPLLAQLSGAGPFRALLDAGITLEGLRTEEKRDVLIAAAGAPLLGIALAAWRRLGELGTWPAPAELDTEARLAAGLAERTERSVRDSARHEALRVELAREGVRRWRVALRSAPDDRVLGEILARRGAFGVGDNQLTADEKYNGELQRLKQIDWRKLPETQVVAAREEAVGTLRSLAGGQTSPALAKWFQNLMDLVVTDQQGAQSDLRKLGPGAVGWTGQLSSDGRQVTYRRQLGGQEQQLVFVLVDGERTVPFFLCTTEMSAGLLLDISADAAINARLKQWLTDAAGTTQDDDPRNGPQVWRLDRRQVVRLNERWTGVPQPAWPKQLYSADIPDPAQPGRNVPAQYVPPAAARFLAQEILGCRLPTPDEWQALVETGLTAKTAGPKGPNVRDAVWQRERDYLLSANVADLPIDADIFWPGNATTQKRGRLAQPVAPDRDDGVLWFAPVGLDQPENVHHLVGNVAEYLYDETGDRFYVAGGSALSPPEVDPANPYVVDTRLAAGGFSDVGMRLAFSAPGGLAGRSRLQILIRTQPFLRP